MRNGLRITAIALAAALLIGGAKQRWPSWEPPVCAYIEGPVTGEVFSSVWRSTASITVTEIWCETDADTVLLDLRIDDGTPLVINGSNISCAVSPGTSDTSFANAASLAKTDRMDIVLSTVTTAVRLSVCWRYRVH